MPRGTKPASPSGTVIQRAVSSPLDDQPRYSVSELVSEALNTRSHPIVPHRQEVPRRVVPAKSRTSTVAIKKQNAARTIAPPTPLLRDLGCLFYAWYGERFRTWLNETSNETRTWPLTP